MKLTLVAHIRKADLVLVDQVKEFFKQDPRFGFNRVRCAFYVKDGYQHFSVLIGGLEHLDITPPSVGPLENFLTSEVRNLLWVLGRSRRETSPCSQNSQITWSLYPKCFLQI